MKLKIGPVVAKNLNDDTLQLSFFHTGILENGILLNLYWGTKNYIGTHFLNVARMNYVSKIFCKTFENSCEKHMFKLFFHKVAGSNIWLRLIWTLFSYLEVKTNSMTKYMTAAVASFSQGLSLVQVSFLYYVLKLK